MNDQQDNSKKIESEQNESEENNDGAVLDMEDSQETMPVPMASNKAQETVNQENLYPSTEFGYTSIHPFDFDCPDENQMDGQFSNAIVPFSEVFEDFMDQNQKESDEDVIRPDGRRIVIDSRGSKPTAGLMKIAQRFDANGVEINPHPTRSAARSKNTERQYEDRIRGLYKGSSAARTTDLQNPVEPSPLEVVQDLIASVTPGIDGDPPQRSKASWHIYRSALLWHLSSMRNKNEAYREAYEFLAETKNPVGVKISSQREKRTFVKDDLKMILNTLGGLNRHKDAMWGSRTAYWIQAGIAAGARGIEWHGTTWLDRDKLQLLIPTSKIKSSKPAFFKIAGATNAIIKEGSRNELARTVYDLEDDHENDIEYEQDGETDGWAPKNESHRVVRIDENDAIYVDMHLASIERHAIVQRLTNGVPPEVAFDRYYEMARRTMRNACEIAFKGKKYYRLYTTRSQFSADRKVDHSIGAVAEMMGHSDIKTTMSSYGSRAAGLKGRKAQSDLLLQSLLETSRKTEKNPFESGRFNEDDLT